jgi:ribosome-associated protein
MGRGLSLEKGGPRSQKTAENMVVGNPAERSSAGFWRWKLDGLVLARTLVRALEDKKAEEILLIDVQGHCSFADYFVICSGSSDRMLHALAESVVESAHKEFHAHARTQGRSESGWVLVDLGPVIAHIFSPDRREYYTLEEFWKDAKVLVHIQ